MKDMDSRQLVQISKMIAKTLRHKPESLGLQLEEGGWIGVDTLLAAFARKGYALSRVELEEVVARNDKRRFAFDETREHIRASQGPRLQCRSRSATRAIRAARDAVSRYDGSERQRYSRGGVATHEAPPRSPVNRRGNGPPRRRGTLVLLLRQRRLAHGGRTCYVHNFVQDVHRLASRTKSLRAC